MVLPLDERTFIRLHDGMPDHPKVVGLSDAAFRLYIEAMCYCSRHLTDGRLPVGAARRMGTTEALAELADAELVEVDGDGWQVRDYLKHQRSAEQVAAAKERASNAGRRSGEVRRERKANESLNEASNSPLNESFNGSLNEQSNETRTETETETDTTTDVVVRGAQNPRRARQITAEFTVDAGMRAWAQAQMPYVDVDAETAKFVDYFIATGKPMKNWTAAWRNWMRNASERNRRPVPPQRAGPMDNLAAHLQLITDLQHIEGGAS